MAHRIVYKIIYPLLFYFVCFTLLTFPLIQKFSTHIFGDNGDGLQNYWNIWWVNKAITELHQSPFTSTYIHYPHGVPLIGHTLNIFNGIIGVLLLNFLTLTETYNVIIIFSFVTAGLTTFLFVYQLTKHYYASIVAGYLFTFSQYHFGHADGHMQLVSLQWIPLFLLYLYLLFDKPSFQKAFFASLALFLVLLCDYYYFFYCALTGLVLILWKIFYSEEKPIFNTRFLLILSFFILVSITLNYYLISNLLQTAIFDGFTGSHSAKEFSLDILGPFIPGSHWRFSNLTKPYWSSISGNTVENSAYIGWTVTSVIVYLLIIRKKSNNAVLSLFLFLFALFYLFSLGTNLRIWGIEVFNTYTPYQLLTFIFPILHISGVPSRMIVMATLFSSILFGFGIKHLIEKNLIGKKLLFVVSIILVFELLPTPIPETRIQAPEYVAVLQAEKETGGVVDFVSEPGEALYFQTIYNKPLVFGYIARIPRSVNAKNHEIEKLLYSQQFKKLHTNYDIKYFITKEKLLPEKDCTLLSSSNGVQLYDIASCNET